MSERTITGTVRFTDGVEIPVCWNGANGREVESLTIMGERFGRAGECEWRKVDEMALPDGTALLAYETGCGRRHTWWPDGLPTYCPSCGGGGGGRMTATEELRALLDGRGVEYKCGTGPGNVETVTIWRGPYGERCFSLSDLGDGTLRIQRNLTPQQAVDTTLGSGRETRLEKLVRVYGEIGNYFCERFACCDAEFANCKYCIGLPKGGQCELGWCNDESKALGIEQPDYGGGECEPVNLQELYDKISEFENEIATLGRGECEWLLEHSGTLYDRWRCGECGFVFVEPRCDQGYTDLEPNYCPNCGKAVKR